MKTCIEVDDLLLAKVLSECVERSVSFERFLIDALRDAVEDHGTSDEREADIPALVAMAVTNASALAVASTFHLDDICPPDAWRMLNVGERKIFGKAFRKAVEGSSPQIALHVGRTSGNKAIYERV